MWVRAYDYVGWWERNGDDEHGLFARLGGGVEDWTPSWYAKDEWTDGGMTFDASLVLAGGRDVKTLVTRELQLEWDARGA